MHIGIDARLFGAYHRGIGRYTEQLILGLEKIKDDNQYTLFMRAKDAQSINLDKERFRIIIADIGHYTLKEQIMMPGIIKKANVDCMHFPHLNAPLFCTAPFIVTIHDLIVHHFPDSRATNLPDWKYGLKVKAYHIILKRAVSKSRAIIAVSEFTKRDLVRHLSADEKKIFVIYPGVEKMLLGTEKMQNTPQFSAMLAEKFNITKRYLLYVGAAYPHKNLERLIDAYKIIRKKYNRNWQLIFCGREDEFYKRLQKYVSEAINHEKMRDDIVFTGHVNDRDLDGLYRGAKLFVFPSLYEGFGLPPLEAASRATAVACSRSSSIPEVMSDSAYYFDPKSAESMARAIDKAGGSHAINAELSGRGLERSRQFSWDSMAKQTARAYQSAFRNG